MTRDQDIPGNQGIIANTVSANMIVTGQNPTATQNNFGYVDVEQLRSLIAELQNAIEALSIPPNSKASISKQVEELAAEAQKPTPDGGRVKTILGTLSSSAKLLGDFVTNATTILGPIAKIAALFGFAVAI
jgi:hypothetical protein